ncbi:hypothetical protein F5Y18DRAFT_415014 [Xylariaceae sp. FL1019]|nr:hypothetical protein F5Y18DRAFT_415014 [Xylariaceae sp. FL1019]
MDVTAAIAAVKAVLPASQFAFRGTDEYQSLNSNTYQSGLNGDITPACIFQPRTAQDISKFLLTIAPIVATGEAAFAIVGAGRQPAPGCSNIQDGITLNLRLLNNIDVKNGYVSIGAGANCGLVYEKLQEHGLACAGARSAKGGFTGLALSGGLSFFSSRDGFICDEVRVKLSPARVVNYEVVLASGAIVNANAEENHDLWIALRGGGNNFGVVTRLDLRTFKQASQLKSRLCDELTKPHATPLNHLMVSLGFAGALSPKPLGLNQLYYLDDMETTPPVLEPFTSMEGQIPGYNTLRRHTFVEAAHEQAGEISIPARSAYMNTHVRPDAETIIKCGEIWISHLASLKGLNGFVCSYTLQPYARSLLEASAKKGGNSLGLSPDGGAIVSIALLAYWTNPADDDKILETFREALRKIDEEASSRDHLLPFKFLNYSSTFQDPIGSYGAKSKERLQKVSKDYDPDGLFQKGVPGGWKLFP